MQRMHTSEPSYASQPTYLQARHAIITAITFFRHGMHASHPSYLHAWNAHITANISGVGVTCTPGPIHSSQTTNQSVTSLYLSLSLQATNAPRDQPWSGSLLREEPAWQLESGPTPNPNSEPARTALERKIKHGHASPSTFHHHETERYGTALE